MIAFIMNEKNKGMHVDKFNAEHILTNQFIWKENPETEEQKISNERIEHYAKQREENKYIYVGTTFEVSPYGTHRYNEIYKVPNTEVFVAFQVINTFTAEACSKGFELERVKIYIRMYLEKDMEA